MDLHILFSQKPEEGAEAGALPLSLHLDDEVQLHCSEFVQKEISRFKDHLQESYPQAKGGETDGSGAEESEGDHAKKGKKSKPQAVDADRRKREYSQRPQNCPPLILPVKYRKRPPISNASMSSFVSCSPS
jgi:hypothetical protein